MHTRTKHCDYKLCTGENDQQIACVCVTNPQRHSTDLLRHRNMVLHFYSVARQREGNTRSLHRNRMWSRVHRVEIEYAEFLFHYIESFSLSVYMSIVSPAQENRILWRYTVNCVYILYIMCYINGNIINPSCFHHRTPSLCVRTDTSLGWLISLFFRLTYCLCYMILWPLLESSSSRNKKVIAVTVQIEMKKIQLRLLQSFRFRLNNKNSLLTGCFIGYSGEKNHK